MATRRETLTGAGAALLALFGPKRAAAQAVISDAPAKVAFVVGTPGEYNWQVVRARDYAGAIKLFRGELDDGDHLPEEDCCCEMCITEVDASRVPEFDKLPEPTPADWLRVGWGHCCSRCSEEVCPDGNGHAIGDEAVCSICLTSEEQAAIEGRT